jgi:threonine dehydrogenase-like Zn-dependent dehydrogenase
MTAMGGMGLFFDGGYAEYTVVPSNQVQAITIPTKLGWEVLGALPEMLQVSVESRAFQNPREKEKLITAK